MITAEGLRPYIEAARSRIGKRRTDPSDIVRILYEHGACSTAAELALRRSLPAVPSRLTEHDRVRIRQLHTAEADMALRGYTATEATWRASHTRRPLGGHWDELLVIDRELRSIYDLDTSSSQFDAAVEAAYAALAPALMAICGEVAADILTARRQEHTETCRDCPESNPPEDMAAFVEAYADAAGWTTREAARNLAEYLS